MTGRFRASSLLTYENSLVLMLGVTFGVVFMDRLAVNYLAPFILPDLRLSAAQIGLASSALPDRMLQAGIADDRDHLRIALPHQ